MRLTTILVLLTSLLPFSSANNTTSTRSTFIYTSNVGSTAGNRLVWSINSVKSTGDVYFHIEAPASGSWIAVGFGAQMANSLMMIAYPSSNGTGITISPRIATGHSEPSYASNIKVEKMWSNITTNYVDNTNNTMYIDAVCRSCSTWSGGSLNFNDTKAPFIFAAGPGEDMNSDDLAAPLKRHSLYGHFTMDMVAATSATNGSVPQPVNGDYTVSGASSDTGTQKDNNFAPGAHAGLMILSWLIIFPLGSIILRLFDKVILHSIVQGIGFFFVLVSFGLGCYISSQYNRSKSFQSAHQIIGLLLLLGLLAQVGLGIVGHRIFKKTGQPAKFGKVHLILGPVLIVVAIINGGLGWKLAGTDWMVMRYAIGVIAIFIVFIPLRIVAHMCVRRRQRNKARQNGPGDYQYPQFVAPKQPNVQAVPLQTFHSTESVPQYHGQAQQPRPMV